LVYDEGRLVAKRRIGEDAAGWQLLLDLLAEHGDSLEAPIPVAIETSRGLLVAGCVPVAARSMRSTRWPLPVTANGTVSHGPSPTTPTP
jgi:hypothetical protein